MQSRQTFKIQLQDANHEEVRKNSRSLQISENKFVQQRKKKSSESEHEVDVEQEDGPNIDMKHF